MILIFKIARTELRNLFFSPVAWFLLLIFLIICAVFYTSPLLELANFQDSMQRVVPSFKEFQRSLTQSVFMSQASSGFIGNVFSNLYLFIPLLTMGLINKEFTGGTVKLLYSSPVKLHQIIWGKYLAVMVYNLILFTIILVLMVMGGFSIANIDTGHLIAGLITFYLVVCSYTAIGMFMSSVSHYQIVSAIATFTLLFVLQRIGTLWQEYDFIREITYFLSINGRAERMLYGLISSRDVFYYALITCMFVTFSYLNLLHGRELVSTMKKVVRYTTVFILVLTVGYFTSRPGYIAYWDGTATKQNTVSENTQEILKSLGKDELEVTLYTNLLDKGRGFDNTRPSQRNQYIWGFWEKYVRFKSNIKFKYVLFYDILDGDSSLYKRMPGMSMEAIAKEYAKIKRANFEDYLTPAEIRKIVNLESEDLRSIMHLKYKGKTFFLRNFDDPKYWPDEIHVAAALKRLANDTIPKTYAITGNFERSIVKTGEREYYDYVVNKNSRSSLINQGFEMDTLNLSTQHIPEDAMAIVLADPKMPLNATVSHRLNEYIEKGGNMLIMGEPEKQYVLNPFIQSMGASLMPGTIVQISENETPDKVVPFVTMDHTWLLKEKNYFSMAARLSLLAGHPAEFMHPGAAGVSFNEGAFKATRLMLTHPESGAWVKAGKLVTDSAAPVFVAREGDYILDSMNVAIALNRQVKQKDQRIIIVGDADFNSNVRYQTQKLAQNYLAWLTYETFPIHVIPNDPKDTILKASLQQANAQRIILVWILPAAIAVFCSILLIRRKRQ